MQHRTETKTTKWFAMAAFIFAAIGGVLYGYDLGIISGALLFVRDSIPMTDDQISYLASSVMFGGAFATLITGFLSDRYGRRKMILLASVIFIISVVMIVRAHEYWTLMAGRLVQGIGVGMITIAVPLYLSESMPTRLRGFGVTTFQLLLTAGILAAGLVSVFFASSHDWRGMFATAAVPGIVMFFGCFLLTDSPRWLAMKGRYKKALEVLKKTRTRDEAAQEVKHMRLARESGRKGLGAARRSSLMQKRYLVPLAIALGVGMLNQLTGINSLLQLSAFILKDAGLESNMVDILGGSAIFGLNFVMTLVAVSLVDRVERRHMMMFGTGGIVLSFIFCGAVYFILPHSAFKGFMLLGGVLGFIFFYAIGPGALVWSILSEVLPSRIRSTGMAVALFLNSMTSAVFSAVFIPLTHHIGYAGVFWLCACFTIIYFIVSWRMLPKTKGQSLEDIEAQFIHKEAV